MRSHEALDVSIAHEVRIGKFIEASRLLHQQDVLMRNLHQHEKNQSRDTIGKGQ